MHSLSSQLLQEQRLTLTWCGRAVWVSGSAVSANGSPQPGKTKQSKVNMCQRLGFYVNICSYKATWNTQKSTWQANTYTAVVKQRYLCPILEHIYQIRIECKYLRIKDKYWTLNWGLLLLLQFTITCNIWPRIQKFSVKLWLVYFLYHILLSPQPCILNYLCLNIILRQILARDAGTFTLKLIKNHSKWDANSL